MKLKFGKKPAVFDLRTPNIQKYLTPKLLTSPPRKDWIQATGLTNWHMMLNNQLGDCVIAEKGHTIMLWSKLAAKKLLTLPDSVILAGYEAVGGYVPGNPNTDQGCDMLTATKYFMTTGYGGQRIDAYATLTNGGLTSTDIPVLQACINLFGSVPVGFQVPASAMDQFNSGKPWDVVADDGGIVGGHDVPLMMFDKKEKMTAVITWGRKQYATDRFWLKYMDESYTYASKLWIAATGLSPSGQSLLQLVSDLSQVNRSVQRAMPSASILGWIQQQLKTYGPIIVPIIEALLPSLPLTPDERLIVQALINAIMAKQRLKVRARRLRLKQPALSVDVMG